MYYPTFKNFLLIFLFSIWISIDTHSLNFISNSDPKTIFTSSLFFRFFFSYFCFFFMFCYSDIKWKTNFTNVNFFLLIFLAKLLIETFSLVNNNGNLHYLTYILSSIFFLIVLINSININLIKKIFYFSFLILFFTTLLYSSVILRWFFLDSNDLNLYGTFPHSLDLVKNLSDNVPRSSGLGRSCLLLSLPLLIHFFIKKKLDFKLYVIYLFLIFIVILTQSRIVLLIYTGILFLFIFYIFIFKLSLLDCLKKLFIIFIFPIIFTLFIVETKSFFNKYDFNVQKLNSTTFIRTIDPKTFTSHRSDDWFKIINKNNNFFLGNGVMGDRYLINQTASNILLYSYASGGIVSVLICLIFILRSIYTSFIILIINAKNIFDKKNFIIFTASSIQCALIARALVESSFGIFGIDFLLFYVAFFLTENYFYDLNKKNFINKKELKTRLK